MIIVNTFNGDTMNIIKKTMFFLFSFFIFVCLVVFVCNLIPKPLLDKSNNIVIYDYEGNELIKTHYELIGEYVEITDINENFLICFVASEDENFYNHHGFSFIGIIRAIYNNIKNDTTTGGSTITQQLARSVFLDNEKTITRKVKEAFITLRLELHYDKGKILEQYLNNIYLGHNIYGIQQASRYYFNKDNLDLSLDEVALIVGIANAPNINAPDINYDNAISRRNYVLKRLLDNKLINNSEYERLLKIKTKVNINKDQFDDINMSLVYYVKNKLSELKLNDKKLLASGLNIYTTIDSKIQKQIFDIACKNNPKDNSEIAIIILKPNSSDVLALLGGYNKDNQYNRAIYANRPIGSTIKPLLYYLALRCNMNPLTYFMCNQKEFKVEGFEPYTPTNASNTYANKKINMIEAIGLSDNVYATKTLLYVGFDNFTKMLKMFDVDINCVVSSALGVDELSLIKLASIYNTFASLGNYHSPRIISKITDNNGNTLYKNSGKNVKLLDKTTTLILNQLLTSPFDYNLIDYTHPTLLNYKPKTTFAAKTGSNEYNSYVIGYNPLYTIAIWTGTDNNEVYYSKNVSKKVFKEIANTINIENIWYLPNDEINVVRINPITGDKDSNGSIYWI